MSLAKRILLGLIAGLIAALSATAMHVASAASDEDGVDGDLTETLTLHPGDNFIGWVAEAKPVTEVFAEIPQAQLIYRWDADSRTYQFATRDGGGSLENVQPGMAVKIRISGERSVKWERSLMPAKGMVTLYSGINWVAWNGRDDWPLEQVARGIGTSLVSIEVRGQVYQPGSNVSNVVGPLSGESTIRRGDALRVNVKRDLRWLQPTGMLPNIVWVGDISQSLKDEITTDIRRVVDFFAEEFAVETDFSETTALIWTDVDAAVKYAESGAEPQFGGSPDSLRSNLTHHHLAAGRPWGFYVPACGWQPSCPAHGRQRGGILTLVHEWLHHIQGQLSGQRHTLVSPVWMIEGPAIWAEWQLPTELHNHPLQSQRQWRIEATARATATLQSVEQPYTGLAYQLGSAAAEQLAERSDSDAHIEYNRQLYPQVVGKERRWVQGPTWLEAFGAAFGVSAAEFYREFATWRETLPTRGQRYNYDPDDVRLSGTLRYNDGEPAPGFRVEASAYLDGYSVDLARTAIVGEDGDFVIELAPKTTQRIEITRDGCKLWLSEHGLTTTYPEPGQHLELNTERLSRLNLTLPQGACENELRVNVIRLRGDERHIQVFMNDEANSRTYANLGASGVFTAFGPEPGAYRVRVRLDSCGLSYSKGELVASEQDAEVLELSEQLVSIGFRIPHSLCVRQISGRVVSEDGGAVGGFWINAAYGYLQGAVQSSANGDFSIVVPDSGDYVLQLYPGVHGCWVRHSSSGATPDWHRATPITVSNEDVTGIEFVVPEDPASLCN